MDVTLPNGRVITGVPEGTTQSQLRELAVKNNLAKPEDFPEEPGFFDNVGDLGDLVRGAGYGVTSLPALAVEGVGALGYSLGLSDDLSENELVQWGRKSQKGLREFFGGDEGTKAYGLGNALGSFASFFIPGLGQAGLAARGLSAAGRVVGTGGTTALAVGAGAGDQAERILNLYEKEGNKYPAAEENLKQAILQGGAIGLSELAPVRMVGKILSKGIPKSVPSDTRNKILGDAANILFKTRPRRIASVGIGEGTQEAFAGYLQDLTEKGLYNPNLEVGESAMADFGYGASAGAIFQGGLELMVPGLRNRRRIQQQEEERQEAEKLQVEAQREEEVRELGPAGQADALPLALPAPEPPKPTLLLEDLSEASDTLINEGEDVSSLVEQTLSDFAGDLPLSFNRGAIVAADELGTPDAYEVSTTNKGSFVQSKQGVKVSPYFATSQQAAEFRDGINLGVNDLLETQDRAETNRLAAEAIKGAGYGPDSANVSTGALLDAARKTQVTDSIPVSDLPGDTVTQLNARRVQTGQRTFSPDDLLTPGDLAEAGVSEEIISQVAPSSSLEVTPDDVLSLAEQKNIMVEDAGFERFAQRLIGSARIDSPSVSPGQLGYLYETVEQMPALPGDGPQRLPVIKKPEFSGTQYAAVVSLAKRKGQNGILKSDINKSLDLKRGAPTESIINSAVDRGDLIEHPTRKNRWMSRSVYDAEARDLDSPLRRGEQIEGDAVRQEAEEARRRETLADFALGPGIQIQRDRASGDTRSIPEASRDFKNRIENSTLKTDAQLRMDDINQSIGEELKRFQKILPKGMKIGEDIQVKLVDSLGEGREGAAADPVDGKVVISLALDLANTGAKTTTEVKNNLKGVLNHEVIHALRSLGVLTDADFAILEKYAKNNKRKGDALTFYEDIAGRYTKYYEEKFGNPPTEELLVEESIADAFRYWADGNVKLTGKPRSLFNRIVDFFKSLSGGFTNADMISAEQMFDGLRSPLGARQRDVEVGLQAPDAPPDAVGDQPPDAPPRDVGVQAPDAPADAVADPESVKYSLYPVQLDGFARRIIGADAVQDGNIRRRVRASDVPREMLSRFMERRLSRDEESALDRQKATIEGKYSLARKPVDPKDPVFSARNEENDKIQVAGKKLPKSGKARKLSSVDILYNPEFQARKGVTAGYVAKLIQARARRVLDKPVFLENDTSKDGIISDALAMEAIAALNESGNASNWYSTKVEQAVDTAAELYPEIRTDPEAKFAFLTSLAITSQNTPVMENSRYTVEVYDRFKQDGRFPEDYEKGKHGKAMSDNFKLLNRLVDEMGSLQAVGEFFEAEFTVKDLKKKGYKPPSGENVDTDVYGSFLLGPKIGQGFYQNLIGNFSPVTIDMWLMRTVGRVTGRLIGKPELIEAQTDRLIEGIRADPEKSKDNFLISSLFDAKIDGDVDAVVEIADQLRLEHDRLFQTPEVQALYRAKQYDKPLWAKASENIITQQFKPQDSPYGGNFRNAVRRVMDKTRKKIEKSGYSVTNADLQAILWYPEKDLFSKLGVRAKQNLNIDYADAFDIILKERTGDETASVQAVGRGEDGSLIDDGRGEGEVGEGLGRVDGEQTKFSLARNIETQRGNLSRYLKAIGAPNSAFVGRPLSPKDEAGYYPRLVITDPDGKGQSADVFVPNGFDRVIEDPAKAERSVGFGAAHYEKHQAKVPVHTYGAYGNVEDLARAALKAYWPFRQNPKAGGFDVKKQSGPTGNTRYRLEWKSEDFGYPAVFVFEPIYYDVLSPRFVRENPKFAGRQTAQLVTSFIGPSDKVKNIPIAQPAISVDPDRTLEVQKAVDRGVNDAINPPEARKVEREILSLKSKFSLRRQDNGLTQDQKRLVKEKFNEEKNETFFEKIMGSMKMNDPRDRPVWLRMRAAFQDRYAGARYIAEKADLEQKMSVESHAWTAFSQLERSKGVSASAITKGPLIRSGGLITALSEKLINDSSDPAAKRQYEEAFERLQRETRIDDYIDATTGERVVLEYKDPKDLKGLAEIFAELDQNQMLATFQLYAAGRRAQRLKQEGRENLFTDAEIETAIQAGVKNPAVERAYREYQLWNKSLVNMMRDTGVISAEAAELWTQNADYLPFYRQAYDDAGSLYDVINPDLDKAGDLDQVSNDPNNEVFENMYGIPAPKELKGGKPAFMILVNNTATEKAYTTYDSAKARADILRKMNKGAKVRVVKTSQRIESPLDNILRNLDAAVHASLSNVAASRAVRDLHRLDMARRLGRAPASPNADTVGIRVDGKTVYYNVDDPYLLNAMKSSGEFSMGFLDILTTPARVLRELITKEPGFMLANLMRDSMSSWMTSGVTTVPGPGTALGLAKAVMGSAEAEALEAVGFVGGYDFKRDKRAEKIFKQQRRSPLSPAKWWDTLDKLTMASDTATRVAVYNRVLETTQNPTAAMFEALEVINFSRRGANTFFNGLTATIPFLNARIQGLDVMFRGAQGKVGTETTMTQQERKKRFIYRFLTFAALNAMYSFWLMSEDEEENPWYYNANETDKDMYWIISPRWFGIDSDFASGFKIPIPFELGVIGKVIPERIIRSLAGNTDQPDNMKSLMRHVTGTFAVQLPQAMMPLIETQTNHDFYSGRPIVPYWAGRTEAITADATTASPVALGISNQLSDMNIDYDPRKIDHLIRGYLGTVGSYALLMTDGVMRNYLGLPAPAEKRADQQPVLSRFLQERAGTGPTEAFYQLANEVDIFTKTLASLDKQGRADDWYKRAKKNEGLLDVADDVKIISKELSELRKLRRQIDIDPIMSASDKKRSFIEIQEMMNEIVSYYGKRKSEYMRRTD